MRGTQRSFDLTTKRGRMCKSQRSNAKKQRRNREVKKILMCAAQHFCKPSSDPRVQVAPCPPQHQAQLAHNWGRAWRIWQTPAEGSYKLLKIDYMSLAAAAAANSIGSSLAACQAPPASAERTLCIAAHEKQAGTGEARQGMQHSRSALLRCPRQ